MEARGRGAVADALDWLAVRLFDAAHRLRPIDMRPRCPDCRLGPDLGPEQECPVCREHGEQQQRDQEIYGSGYSDGLADMAARYDGDWL